MKKALPEIYLCLCGAPPKLFTGPDLAVGGNKWVAWVECEHCKLRGNDALHSEHRAIKSWNKITTETLEGMTKKKL